MTTSDRSQQLSINKPCHPPVTSITMTRIRLGLRASISSPDHQEAHSAPIVQKWPARLAVLGTVIGSLLLVAWWHGYL